MYLPLVKARADDIIIRSNMLADQDLCKCPPRYMESTLSAVLTRLCKSDSAINCSIVLIHAFCQFSVYWWSPGCSKPNIEQTVLIFLFTHFLNVNVLCTLHIHYMYISSPVLLWRFWHLNRCCIVVEFDYD